MSSTHASKLRLAAAIALANAAFAGTATAQSTKDAAMAETLFTDAKRRMGNGDYAGACPKLAESYRLDPGTGTLTALALCHEQIGKTASAWAEFIQVKTESQQAGRADREKFARQHINALEPTLSRLTITVVPETAKVSDLVVHRDRVSVGSAAWGVASPVDPGEHVIEAMAPGKESWSIRINVGTNGDTEAVTVPALDDAPGNVAPEPAEKVPSIGQPTEPTEAAADAPPPERHASPLGPAGLVVGAAGLVSIGIGSYFGIQAISKSNDAKNACSPSNCASASAVQTNNDAKSDAGAADVLMGAGLVAVIVGGILFFTAPSDPPPSTPPDGAKESARLVPTFHAPTFHLVPSVGAHGGGMLLQTTW